LGCSSLPSGRTTPDRSGSTSQAADVTARTFSRPPPEERPGLATGWGEDRDSRVALTEFCRANGNTPAATGLLYYNDREGTQAMLAQLGGEPRSVSGLQSLPAGYVAVGLQDGNGRWLEGWNVRGGTHVVGEGGERYAVVVRNETGCRIEVVVSVDGLDVLEGKPASYRKRGYILEPYESYNIEGFRMNWEAVAAFRFSPVSQSYAALRHDDTRNVGVIGVAAFTEKNREVAKRREADPFPRSWATPPWDKRPSDFARVMK